MYEDSAHLNALAPFYKGLWELLCSFTLSSQVRTVLVLLALLLLSHVRELEPQAGSHQAPDGNTIVLVY